MNSKAIRKQLLAAVAMVLVAAVALGSSTYAWFVSNSQVTATGFKGTASTSKNLLISLTGGNDYATTVDMGINLAAFTPVSAGNTLIKDAKLYKVETWSDEKDLGTNEFKSTGKLANTFVEGTANTDYAVKDIYLKSTSSQKIYFDDNTVIKAEKNVTVGEANFKVTATLKTSDSTVAVVAVQVAGNVETVVDLTADATAQAVKNAADDVKNALGAMRLTLVDMNTLDEQSKGAPLFMQLTDSNSGYLNTATVAAADVDITASQVIDGVDGTSKRATSIVTDPSVTVATADGKTTETKTLISKYTAEGTTSVTVGSTTPLCTLEADVPQHYVAYVYLEGCDPQCVTGIADNITYTVNLGFYGE